MSAAEQFECFRALHDPARPLILPNAWDAASARLFEAAGFPAVGTTSAGLAWSHGSPDNQMLSPRVLVESVREMAAVISVPLTVDIEAGYFTAPSRFEEFVCRLLDIGIAGVNLQDASGTSWPLLPIARTCRRIEQLRSLGERRDQPLFINARTDVFWVSAPAPDGSLPEAARERLVAYRDAGAHGVFAPGLSDLDTVGMLARSTGLPVNILAGPALPAPLELSRHGVARISLGSSLFRLVYSALAELSAELPGEAGFQCLKGVATGYAEMDAMFSRPARQTL
ncbi:MAG: isocitrate lyase/phosphoenolpyruvate mutase family protein [Gammaproteobacteria bacterium]|jgi:2-methylisocitrate lyase-like PEP mutase family enzyme